jgi:hypothetical protein
LKKAYPFKGVFAWDPWIQSIGNGEFDFNSTMPITLGIGTADPNYSTVLRVYDSLKFHNANVNLVIVPNVGHEYSFAGFTNTMVRCFKYLNDTNAIAISSVSDFELLDSDAPVDVAITITNNTGKKLTYRTTSSNSVILNNPAIVEVDSAHVKLTIVPKVGRFNNVRIIFEAQDNGISVEQMIFNVKVNRGTTAVNTTSNEEKLYIFPNPANHILNVNKNANLSKIEITDIYGRRIMSVLKPKQMNQLDISNLPAGLYLVRAEGKRYSETERFVLQK